MRYNNIHLLHDSEGHMKIYSPKKIIFPKGVAKIYSPKKIIFPKGVARGGYDLLG